MPHAPAATGQQGEESTSREYYTRGYLHLPPNNPKSTKKKINKKIKNKIKRNV